MIEIADIQTWLGDPVSWLLVEPSGICQASNKGPTDVGKKTMWRITTPNLKIHHTPDHGLQEGTRNANRLPAALTPETPQTLDTAPGKEAKMTVRWSKMTSLQNRHIQNHCPPGGAAGAIYQPATLILNIRPTLGASRREEEKNIVPWLETMTPRHQMHDNDRRDTVRNTVCQPIAPIL